MSRGVYFLRYFGVKYTLVSAADSLTVRMLNRQSKTMHKIRTRLIKEYLIKRYGWLIDKYKTVKVPECKIAMNSPIFLFWWQGIDHVPDIVKGCIKSIQSNSGCRPVILLDHSNIEEWIEIPAAISQKVQQGKISLANLADWVRVRILFEYGGIWLDISTFMNDSIDPCVEGLSLFTVKHNRNADYHICAGKWTTGYLGAAVGEPLMGFTKELLEVYWRYEDYIIYYLMIDCIFSIAYENIPAIKKEIDSIPINNEDVFAMMRRINEPYDENLFRNKSGRNVLNKLTYKKPVMEYADGQLTNYGYMMQKE